MNDIKFLGLIVDEKLTWKNHINVVKSKLCKSLGIMKKVQFKIEERFLLSLYYTLFLPYIDYCLEVWGNTFHSNLKCLYLLQKKIV